VGGASSVRGGGGPSGGALAALALGRQLHVWHDIIGMSSATTCMRQGDSAHITAGMDGHYRDGHGRGQNNPQHQWVKVTHRRRLHYVEAVVRWKKKSCSVSDHDYGGVLKCVGGGSLSRARPTFDEQDIVGGTMMSQRPAPERRSS